MASELENLLAQWAARRKLDATESDLEGKRYLVFDGRHEVALSQTGETIVFEADLSDLPARRDQAEDLLEQLLKHQLAHAQTGAEVLSLTETGQTLTMFRTARAIRIELNDFDEMLGAFVNALAAMSHQIASQEGQPMEAALPVSQVFLP